MAGRLVNMGLLGDRDLRFPGNKRHSPLATSDSWHPNCLPSCLDVWNATSLIAVFDLFS